MDLWLIIGYTQPDYEYELIIMIFAREHEIALFDEILSTNEPAFIALYGRRRIGKTYLIHQYFHDKGIYFELTGINRAPLETQLQNFQLVFNDTFPLAQPVDQPTNWLTALDQLRRQVEVLPESNKIIIFIDELPWLATPRSGFLEALNLLWNRYLSRCNNVILVICGSAASWMIEHIIHDTGGLYGRLTKEIYLQPFNLKETEAYLAKKNIELTRQQLIEIYFVTGGVAKYLNYIQPGLSAQQNINQICFKKTGYLYGEFNKLYRSLFKNFEAHIKIVRTLANNPNGLDREILLSRAELASGGTATKILDELYYSGFILKLEQYSQKKQLIYKLSDPFSLFYLKWIEPARTEHLDQIDSDYWLKIANTPSWFSWAGIAFENTCLRHIPQLKSALGISGVTTKSTTWSSPEAQIDLVIDRADQCINLCEIKYVGSEYEITAAYAATLAKKKQAFLAATQSKKALFTTLITTFGAKTNMHYHSAVQQQLTLEALFN